MIVPQCLTCHSGAGAGVCHEDDLVADGAMFLNSQELKSPLASRKRQSQIGKLGAPCRIFIGGWLFGVRFKPPSNTELISRYSWMKWILEHNAVYHKTVSDFHEYIPSFPFGIDDMRSEGCPLDRFPKKLPPYIESALVTS